MSQLTLLKRITSAPHIFKSEADRKKAVDNLEEKMKRRDLKIIKANQLKLDL